MEPFPKNPSKPLARGRAPTSTPLMNVQVYRPGPYLALGILLFPVIVALVGAAVFLNLAGTVPIWLSLVLLLWVPCLPVVWLTMQSVRTDAAGIAAGKPWTTWREVSWTHIERVEQIGPLIRVRGGGRRLLFTPMLLRDGSRLKRQLLLRLPLQVLVGSLHLEAERLLLNGIYPMVEGGLSGTLQAHPRKRWAVVAATVNFAALAGVVLVLVLLPPSVAAPLAVLGLAIVAVTLAALTWLLQEVIINEKGISFVSRLTGRANEMTWAEVELIEHSPRWVFLRMRGMKRLVCAGPALFSPAGRDLMHAFLHEYCVNRGVPIVQRRWLL